MRSFAASITVVTGNPCVVDGLVQIDTDTGTYGQLVFNCDTLDFDGSLEVGLDEGVSGTCDQLIVNGTLALGANSFLNVEVNGAFTNEPETWTILTSTGGTIAPFGYSNAFEQNLVDQPNEPYAGDYSLAYTP
jgi:hypothetical protein